VRKPLVAGNWKMNLNHLEAIAVTQKLAYSIDDKDYAAVDITIIPPFTDIRSIQTLVDGDRLKLTYGAQDLSPDSSGAFTGDISGSMLKKLGHPVLLLEISRVPCSRNWVVPMFWLAIPSGAQFIKRAMNCSTRK